MSAANHKFRNQSRQQKRFRAASYSNGVILLKIGSSKTAGHEKSLSREPISPRMARLLMDVESAVQCVSYESRPREQNCKGRQPGVDI
jgi:hypothetical protein